MLLLLPFKAPIAGSGEYCDVMGPPFGRLRAARNNSFNLLAADHLCHIRQPVAHVGASLTV